MQRRTVVAEFLTLKQWEGLALAPGLICVLPNCPVSPFGLDLLNHPGNTSTTLLGIWQLRDWYGNTVFLLFTPTCYSFCKGCHFRGQMGEVSIKRKKKERKKIQPSGSLEKNPLIYHVNGYHGLRCAVSIEDSDECDRSLQPGEQACRQVSPVWQKLGQRWWWARRSKRDYLLFLILKNIKLL